MVDKKIKDALQVARISLSDAQSQFDSGNNSLQLNAAGSINLFGGAATSQVTKLVFESRRLCDNLYSVCQMQVKILDETCRPYLNENPSAAAVRDIWKMICLLNDESEITNNFTASLNSCALGDVATIQYHPTMECKMIQNYWETKYRSHPGRESFEQEEKATKEKQEQQKNNASAKKKASDEILYQQAMENWKQTEKDIQQKRKKALDDALTNEKQRCEKQIAEKLEKEQNKQNRLLKTYEKEYTDIEVSLASLRFYQFIKKIQHKNSLEEITKKINAARYALETAKREYSKEMQNIDQAVSRTKNTLQKTVNERFPLPRKPRKTAAMLYNTPTPYQLVAEAMKQEILKTLVKHGPLSYTDLIKKCPALADLTTSRVDSYAKALEREGEIKIKQKKIDYTIYNICELAY